MHPWIVSLNILDSYRSLFQFISTYKRKFTKSIKEKVLRNSVLSTSVAMTLKCNIFNTILHKSFFKRHFFPDFQSDGKCFYKKSFKLNLVLFGIKFLTVNVAYYLFEMLYFETFYYLAWIMQELLIEMFGILCRIWVM